MGSGVLSFTLSSTAHGNLDRGVIYMSMLANRREHQSCLSKATESHHLGLFYMQQSLVFFIKVAIDEGAAKAVVGGG